jgi:hypothetical protein
MLARCEEAFYLSTEEDCSVKFSIAPEKCLHSAISTVISPSPCDPTKKKKKLSRLSFRGPGRWLIKQ